MNKKYTSRTVIFAVLFIIWLIPVIIALSEAGRQGHYCRRCEGLICVKLYLRRRLRAGW